MAILADTLSLTKKDTVDMVLFGSDDVDVTKADQKSFIFGVTYPDRIVDLYADRAKPTEGGVEGRRRRRPSGRGLHVPVGRRGEYGFEGVVTDLWLFGTVGGERREDLTSSRS